MLNETIKKARMYSGIKQSKIAKELLMSTAKYNRKENGLLKIELHEALKIAKILDINDKAIMKYWMADKLYELMKHDKELVYEALKIVEMHYDNYDTCIEMPSRNNSFSSLEERIRFRKKDKKNS